MDEYIGGYLEGENQKRFVNISPEVGFLIELNRAWEFLDNFIYRQEYEVIRQNLDKFNYKLYKNPALVLLGYMVYKKSNFKSITQSALNSVFNSHDTSPLIKEYQISLYDLLRYARFYAAFVPIIL